MTQPKALPNFKINMLPSMVDALAKANIMQNLELILGSHLNYRYLEAIGYPGKTAKEQSSVANTIE